MIPRWYYKKKLIVKVSTYILGTSQKHRPLPKGFFTLVFACVTPSIYVLWFGLRRVCFDKYILLKIAIISEHATMYNLSAAMVFDCKLFK